MRKLHWCFSGITYNPRLGTNPFFPRPSRTTYSPLSLGLGCRLYSTPVFRAVTPGAGFSSLQFLEDKAGRYLGWGPAKQDKGYLDLIYLRDCCSCPRCVNPSSTQKEFDSSDIPFDINVAKVEHLPGENVEITWENDIAGYDGHKTVFPVSFWEQNASQLRRIQTADQGADIQPWTDASLSSVEDRIYFEHSEYMGSDVVLHSALKCLRDYGIAFVKGVPDDPTSIIAISNRIGPLQHTFYGRTWNVKALPSATNVAYTSIRLGFHMDLLYMKDPPGLQLLQCMRQSTEGGESLFSDSLNAVYRIQRENPILAPFMWKFPVTYRYKNDGKWYQYNRPMLEGPGLLDVDEVYENWRTQMQPKKPDGLSTKEAALVWGRHFDAINWSPPFQGPFSWDAGERKDSPLKPSGLRGYMKLAQVFRSIIEAPENIHETKMREGTCVIFDNRRIVHARKAFTAAGGERWLRGAYIDGNSYKSRLRAFEAGMT